MTYLPNSNSRFRLGFLSRLRNYFAKKMIDYSGENINIERKVNIPMSLKIGNNSGIGEHSFVQGGVTIGENVMIGPYTYIYTQNHIFDSVDLPILKQGRINESVKIGDDVWIGSRVTILPGVTIHNGAVIGTCTVVTKDVEEYSIIAGNPGKVVGSRTTKEV
jgi:maltose O-acetyltransferase